MSRLVFVSNRYFPNVVGGAELSVQTLVEELVRRGEQVSVISLSDTGADSVDEINGITVYRVATANVYQPFSGSQPAGLRAAWHLLDIYNPLMARKVATILEELRPDWVSTHNVSGFSVAVWNAARAAGARVVHTLHDYYLMCPRTTMFRDDEVCKKPCFRCSVYSAPKKRLSDRVDLVIAVSQFMLSRFLESGYFPRARSGVVYNGRPLPSGPSRALRQRGDPLVVGFIGRVAYDKGVEVLLEAVSNLEDERVRLRLAGRCEPAYQAALERKFPLANVEYLGFVQPETFYPSVDVVVIPSLWEEPFGMVAVEPLGYGIPVISSAVGGLAEVTPGEQGGWSIPPGDVGALTARLRQILNHEYDAPRMQERALARRDRFLPVRQAEDYLALLKSTEGGV